MDPAWIALIGTIFGGVGLKVAESWLTRGKTKLDVRRDLNSEIDSLLGRIDKLEDEVTDWRTRFYEQQEQVALLRTMLIHAGVQLPETTTAPPKAE